ncbi:hypothetical protein GCM10011444_10360 [Winogradskyella haliclonae]|uniref:Uncharacterized protein n=1 Tax=Winogradskyella haliclonae TaxID=2048558 RepID=A0ABQ2BYU0_9FLAO|nr:hypothetical protein GCM10011444_10360 [Winogradskyella haliclonae]
MEVYDLKNLPNEGGLGIGVSRGGAYFAYFSYEKLKNQQFLTHQKQSFEVTNK